MDSSILRMILTIFLSIICIAIVGYILGITKDERSFINQKIKTLLKQL